ncbi:Histone H4 [Fulvia fulva]|uniref:Histone H4 n=1 Tax=Passalora fulva TaxID=5499 RepID=A0A9Q8US95_PASFU|nr:Histone H4 [Fulvia fulva]KAK4617866.1 Histone H4 [Fulvia fulva]KAK4618870.1 Histone H4 [Fulvia fulva]UJO20545.1 Histone H4 [Fulvia fulva]WPV17878.1 Histone H4 [Fulvia fulva]WPV33475.1 Histone H4 [Fulvia fulva]
MPGARTGLPSRFALHSTPRSRSLVTFICTIRRFPPAVGDSGHSTVARVATMLARCAVRFHIDVRPIRRLISSAFYCRKLYLIHKHRHSAYATLYHPFNNQDQQLQREVAENMSNKQGKIMLRDTSDYRQNRPRNKTEAPNSSANKAASKSSNLSSNNRALSVASSYDPAEDDHNTSGGASSIAKTPDVVMSGGNGDGPNVQVEIAYQDNVNENDRHVRSTAPTPQPAQAQVQPRSGVGRAVTIRRHRYKSVRDNLQGVTEPAIRRLARRGGVVRVSSPIYEDIRNVIRTRCTNVIKKAVIYLEHANRTTVTAVDIVHALNSLGSPIAGFGDGGQIQVLENQYRPKAFEEQ